MKKGIYIIVIMLLGAMSNVFSQQMPIFSQFKENSFFINPALTGAYGFTNVMLTARNQWIGFSDPPRTLILSADGRLIKQKVDVRERFGKKWLFRRKEGNIGLGGAFFSDENSHISRVGAKGSYAYHLKMNYSQLSFGVSVSGYQVSADKDLMFTEQAYDPLMDKLTPSFALDASVGFFYLLKQRLYAGLSVEHVLQTVNIVWKPYNNNTIRHYYFLGGYIFHLNRDYSLEPSVIMQFNDQMIPLLQSDMNLKLTYQDKWWGGLSYRTSNDFIVMGGVKYHNFMFGYSFDYGVGKIITNSYGSHEVCIVYRFGYSDRRFKWKSRYF